MKSNKNISIIINKDYDYKPIRKKEIYRIRNYLTAEVLEIANRFDGPCRVELFINAKGNA